MDTNGEQTNLAKSVTISNGLGRFYLYWAGAAASKTQNLQWFLTTFYVTSPWQRRLLESPVIKRMIGDGMTRKGLLRQNNDIDPARVKAFLLPELLYRSLSRLGQYNIGFMSWAAFLSFLSFGWLSAPYVGQSRVFHVRSGFGRFAMDKAKNAGSICLVDHGIAHPRFLEEVSAKEATRWETRAKWQPVGRYWRCVVQDIEEADHLLVNSEFVRDTVMAYSSISSNRVHVIPLGADIKLFQPNEGDSAKEGTFRVLFVGSVGLRKGVLYLIDAFHRLHLPDAELLLVGPMSPEVKRLLPRYEGTFRYLPFVPQPDLVGIFQSATVFVFPSLAEGSARATYEAMACGLPVVTTPNSGSVVRDGVDGSIVPAHNVEALMERIAYLYEHRDLAYKMGKAARRSIEENYTWEKYQERILNLYHKLMAIDRHEERLNDLP